MLVICSLVKAISNNILICFGIYAVNKTKVHNISLPTSYTTLYTVTVGLVAYNGDEYNVNIFDKTNSGFSTQQEYGGSLSATEDMYQTIGY